MASGRTWRWFFVCFLLLFHSGLNLGVGHRMEFFFSTSLGEREQGGEVFICVTFAGTDVTLDVQRTNENQIPHSRVFVYFYSSISYAFLLCQFLTWF